MIDRTSARELLSQDAWQRTVKAWEARRLELFDALLRLSLVSSDPNVRGQAMQIDGIQAVLESVKDAAEGETDGGEPD